MTLQTGKQIITIHILSNITRKKGNQAMKFGQSKKKITGEKFCLKNHTQNLAE